MFACFWDIFFNLNLFLQSCVDGCHSSATLLDHFGILWRPFATIMQIMNNGCPSFGAYNSIWWCLLCWAPEVPEPEQMLGEADFQYGFRLEGVCILLAWANLKWSVQKWVQNVQYVGGCFKEWSCPLMYSFLFWCGSLWMNLMCWCTYLLLSNRQLACVDGVLVSASATCYIYYRYMCMLQ